MSGTGREGGDTQAIQRKSRQSGEYLDKVSKGKRDSKDDSGNLGNGDDTDSSRRVRKRCPLEDVENSFLLHLQTLLFLIVNAIQESCSGRTTEPFANPFLKCIRCDCNYSYRIFFFNGLIQTFIWNCKGPRKAKTVLKKYKEGTCPTRN